MQIYLVRHPRPRRSEGLCYGRTDVPVDPDVLAAAAASLRLRIPAHVLRRAARWRRCAARVAAGVAERGAAVIAVTHAGLVRVAIAGASRLGPELAQDVPFGSVHRVDLDAVALGAFDCDGSQACTP